MVVDGESCDSYVVKNNRPSRKDIRKYSLLWVVYYWFTNITLENNMFVGFKQLKIVFQWFLDGSSCQQLGCSTVKSSVSHTRNNWAFTGNMDWDGFSQIFPVIWHVEEATIWTSRSFSETMRFPDLCWSTRGQPWSIGSLDSLVHVIILWNNSRGWASEIHQLRQMLNIPLFIGVQASGWWCRISQPSTVLRVFAFSLRTCFCWSLDQSISICSSLWI